MTRPRVVVIGGGLAGLSAAVRCADNGWDVTLLESKPRLGGQTYSFARGDLVVDNGQHVFLRCCTSYRAFLDRLGVSHLVRMQDRLDVPIVDTASGRRHRLRRNRLPAPLHLAPALLRYGALSRVQRLRLALAMQAMGKVDATSEAADTTSFGDWLRAHRQDARTVEAVWDLIGVATLNARADDASLALAATVFQIGLLTDTAAGDLGWSRVPLQRLHGDPAAAELARMGASVRCGARVEAITHGADGWTVQLRDGDELAADAVVLAVAPAAAERLLPEGATSLPTGWAERLGTSPILNVHFVYSSRVMDEPYLAGLGAVVPWVFDCTEQVGLTEGQAVTVPISAADHLIDLPAAVIRDKVGEVLATMLPRTRGAQVRDYFVTREREATFRPSPGSGVLRPGPVTALPGLLLAGAWTDTGWPATMEGAVRSGESAAAALGQPQRTMLASRLTTSPTEGVPA
ncbi:MAG: hydroxysqualene dehydroxylase [Frankiales bacterium]|jgi:squalene-associated FAD-dependent desaturase|nr:hydroxysqualene dehydroxylase [Frankiales bacterium]